MTSDTCLRAEEISGVLDRTWQNGRFLEITDGGNFENLGVYELLRRHVRTIVVCDATADPKSAFADLQNLLSRDLQVGNNIRVPALNVARIHGRRGVAVHTSVRDEGVRVQRAGVKHAVDLPEASTRTGRAGIGSSIDVVAENVLRCTRGPRK